MVYAPKNATGGLASRNTQYDEDFRLPTNGPYDGAYMGMELPIVLSFTIQVMSAHSNTLAAR